MQPSMDGSGRPAATVAVSSATVPRRRPTEAEIANAEDLARKFGPTNCWTGTSGTLATYLMLMVNEVRALRAELLFHLD